MVRPLDSPWSSVIWACRHRLSKTERRHRRRPISFPMISDLLDQLGRCEYFTTLG